MKKVLLLAPMSSVHERFNKVNIDVLSNMKCEIHIAANFEDGDDETVNHNLSYKKQMESNGIIVHQIPFKRSSLMKNLSSIKMCRKLFVKENFDMIHAHTETGGLITRMAMPTHINTKYIFTPHGMSFYKGSSIKSWLLYYPIERWICSKMYAVLAMNKEESDILKKWNAKTAEYIHGIGIDVNIIKETVVDRDKKRKELGIPINSFLILSIGELNKNKNHETIIRAIKKVNNPNLYYLICGEGNLKSQIEDTCRSLNLSEKVIFAGYRRDINEIIHIADIFAFPSYHEGLPVSLMEAMAAGLPVVCSNIRGNVDLIESGKGGYLCKPNDVECFASYIYDYILNSKLRFRMRELNLCSINNFDKSKVFDELEKIYSKILNY